MIKLYYASSAGKLSQAGFIALLDLLPQALAEKILRFRRWQDAQLSLYGKLLLKKSLSELGFANDLLNLQYNKYGKPYIAAGVHFNISHSGDMVTCIASTGGRIGIDLEEIKPVMVPDFKCYFENTEWDLINASENTDACFFHYWTAKEAAAKAAGAGFSIPLHKIVVRNNYAMIDNDLWYLKKMELNANYITHIASDQEIEQNILPIKVCFN